MCSNGVNFASRDAWNLLCLVFNNFPVIIQSTTCTTSVCTMQLRCKQVALGGIHADAHQIATRQVKMLGAALARHTGQEEVDGRGHRAPL